MARVSLRNAALVGLFLVFSSVILTSLTRRYSRATSQEDLLLDYELQHGGGFAKNFPLYQMKGVDCRGVLRGDKPALVDALGLKYSHLWSVEGRTDQQYLDLAESCDRFIRDRGYMTSLVSQEERDFPLAYSLVVYRELEQVERLFRAVYRPQNLYCFHVDSKANQLFHKALQAITGCFDNAFVAERRVEVHWGQFSVLEADLVCMEELYRRSSYWRYFINLSGQEFPLKPNKELVQILTAYQGANDVEGIRRLANRTRWEKFKPPDPDILPTQGSGHVVVSREFVKWVLTDHRSQGLQDWVRQLDHPEETFFATINHNPFFEVPGSFMGLDDVESFARHKPSFSRYTPGIGSHCSVNTPRHMCDLTTGDLPFIHTSPHLFANKITLHDDRLVYACLEQRLYNRTFVINRGITVNTTLYRQSVIVRNRLKTSHVGQRYHPESHNYQAEFAKNKYF